MDFDINVEFNKYLKLMNLNRHFMAKKELLERKRAFVAGVSQYHMFQTRELDIKDESEAVNSLQKVEDQLTAFWNEQN